MDFADRRVIFPLAELRSAGPKSGLCCCCFWCSIVGRGPTDLIGPWHSKVRLISMLAFVRDMSRIWSKRVHIAYADMCFPFVVNRRPYFENATQRSGFSTWELQVRKHKALWGTITKCRLCIIELARKKSLTRRGKRSSLLLDLDTFGQQKRRLG